MNPIAVRIAGLTLFVSVASVGLIGCADTKPTGSVKGKVVYKNATVMAGMVNFDARSKGIAATAKIDGGEFSFPEPLEAGTYAVYLLPPAPEPVDPSKGKAKTVVTNLPKKAQDPSTSGVTAEVKAGSNDLTIVVTD
jgi:hypothetical protein